jgi:hypothetical protein
VDPNQALAVTAAAATISALITLVLLLEARASRIASRDTATVVARLGFSEDGEVYDFLYLENLGPAIARDVHMTLDYVDAHGKVAKTSGPIAAAVLAPTSTDRAVFLPSMLFDERPVPDVEQLGTRGLSLRIRLDWLDDRRWFPAWLISRRHRTTADVDLQGYARSNLKALRVVDTSLIRELQATRKVIERQHREESARHTWADNQLPPDIRARHEAMHFDASIEVWKARARYWLGRLRGRRR